MIDILVFVFIIVCAILILIICSSEIIDT